MDSRLCDRIRCYFVIKSMTHKEVLYKKKKNNAQNLFFAEIPSSFFF